MSKNTQQNRLLRSRQFPRSNEYDPKWIISNQMGLNPLWLTEWLCEKIELTRGMRVLDLAHARMVVPALGADRPFVGCERGYTARWLGTVAPVEKGPYNSRGGNPISGFRHSGSEG